MLASITKIWRRSLHICFALLCLRFLHAAWLEVDTDPWPLTVLMAGALGLGVWSPKPALFAFTLAAPLLNGLPTLGFAGGSPAFAFTTLWLGLIARRCIGKAESDRARINIRSAFPLRFPLLVTDTMITALLLSLGVQIWRHQSALGFWTIFCRDSVGNYSNPYYFLSSAFVWLQGLFYFRALIATTTTIFTAYAAVSERTGAPPGKIRSNDEVKTEADEEERKPRNRRTTIAAWARPVFLTAFATMAVFTFIEYKFRIPEGWAGAGFQSPYEDIFSFGSVAVSAFVFTVTIQRKIPWLNSTLQILYCIGLMGLVVASWSRGTWLAAAAFLLVIAWFRLPRWGTIAFLLIAVVSVVMINANAKRPSWQNQVYLSRLLALLRVEKLADKSAGRFDLYHKAVAMIRERPLIGHGIGSFYLTSPRYARTGDPYDGIPNFAHNVFLQIAAEQGVLIAALFASLVGYALWRGLRTWQRSAIGDRPSIFQIRQAGTESLTLLGATLALGAYLQTNLTSNSLNIYPSNQFFFWFLMAVLLTWPHRWSDKAIESDSLGVAGR